MRSSLLCVLCFCTLCVLGLDPKSLLQFAVQQATQTTMQLKNELGTAYPSNSKISGNQQIWVTTTSGTWTSGFYPGILWKLYNYTKDETLKSYALTVTEGLKKQQYNNGFQVTQDPAYHQVILTAAESLSTRYNPTVGCIRSWNGPHFQVIIDNMMNLELLWWASHNGGNSKYFTMAASHADHMIRDCIKKDGSSYHLVDYDPTTGAVLNQTNTPQGYPDGVWSRGEAWALYGFMKSYVYSGYQRYLDTAINIGNYLISHLPTDSIPVWDFLSPTTYPERDTSAASVAAAAFLDLSTIIQSTSPDLSKKYLSVATNILESLATDKYKGDPTKTDVMLLHGCVGYQTSMDVGLIYGDYYFVEGLLNYLEMQK